MIITLDVFSGRPNPSWNLSPKDAKQFIERFAKKSVAAQENYNNNLGYRGFFVEASSDAKLPGDLPSSFYFGGTLNDSFDKSAVKSPLLSIDESDDAVNWLLQKGEMALEEEVFNHVKEALKAQKKSKKAVEDAALDEDLAMKTVALAPCTIANTAYNPGFWNVPAVQPYNNCYNYAMNYKTNTFAQPGRYSGHIYTALSCPNVGTAANWDGCTSSCGGAGTSKLVALVIWPGVDFHWYRRNKEGFWSHKPGSTAARNTDNSGIVINGTTRTPANCNRGNYTLFCGYRYSPTGMYTIK